jgi:hypothetical protein
MGDFEVLQKKKLQNPGEVWFGGTISGQHCVVGVGRYTFRYNLF